MHSQLNIYTYLLGLTDGYGTVLLILGNELMEISVVNGAHQITFMWGWLLG